ncbi:MAG: hypothetical protein IJA71_11165 [Clostridia bacterium]|nr:hypothetical protein [Clostridia bacterium]
MAEVRPIRHETDFRVVPQLYHNDKTAFGQIMLGDAGAFLARIYTQVLEGNRTSRWAKIRKYKASDFRVTKTPFPGGTLVWVDLPLMEDGSHVWATAYAAVVPDQGEAQLYQVEQSVFGTSCIGSVDAQGNHVNHGPLGTQEETVSRILELTLGCDPRKAQEPAVPVPEFRWPEPEEAPQIQLPEEPKLPEPEPETTVSWQPQSLQDDLLHTVFSCNTAPAPTEQEAWARRIMDKIRRFRAGGIGEEDLRVLEKRLPELAPDFVRGHLEEYLDCLDGDPTAFCEYLEELQKAGRWEEADRLLIPLVDHIHDKKLSEGLYLANALERAMWILEFERPFDKPLASVDCCRPLILRAKSLLHGGDRWSAVSLLEEAGELAPVSSAVCEASAEAKLYPEDKLEAYRWMLTFCTDRESLARAYRAMGETYLELGREDVAAALLVLVGELGGRAPGLAGKLSGTVPADDWAGLLRSCGISVGFSELVREAARFLEDPRAGEIREVSVRRALRAIHALEL